jgi:hypothetical protein
MKTCARCGVSVAREDCHRNRYGEYICRPCQAAGASVPRSRRFYHWLYNASGTFRLWLVYLVIAIVGSVAVYKIIGRLASTFG